MLFLLFLFATHLPAHMRLPERSLLISASHKRLILTQQLDVRGHEASLMRTMYDLDHNQVLSDSETHALLPIFLQKSMAHASVNYDPTHFTPLKAEPFLIEDREHIRGGLLWILKAQHGVQTSVLTLESGDEPLWVGLHTHEHRTTCVFERSDLEKLNMSVISDKVRLPAHTVVHVRVVFK